MTSECNNENKHYFKIASIISIHNNTTFYKTKGSRTNFLTFGCKEHRLSSKESYDFFRQI